MNSPSSFQPPQSDSPLFHRAAHALLPLLRLLARKSPSEYFDPVEFLRFCCVGLANTLLDFVVYLAALPFLPLYGARSLSWVVACSFSYAMNRRWVFHAKGGHALAGGRFLLVNLIGLLFGISALEGLTRLGLDRVIAYVLTLPLVALGNYFGYKLWSFKEKA